MKFWDLSAPEPPSTPPEQGFRAALQTLIERKYRELRGPAAAGPERRQRAIAGQRARVEMARRIAQHTGQARLSESTIARRARQDRPPAGVEPFWLQRWAAIDRAGGIQALAQQLGTTAARVRAWRDSKDPEAKPPTKPAPPGVPPPEIEEIGVETDGTVYINGNPYPKRFPEDSSQDYAVLEVDPDGDIMQAWLADDIDTLKVLLEDAIVEQLIWPYWSLPATYAVEYRISDLIQFRPDI